MGKNTGFDISAMFAPIAAIIVFIFLTVPASAMLVRDAREIVTPYFILWAIALIPTLIASEKKYSNPDNNGAVVSAVSILSGLCIGAQMVLSIMVLWRVL